MTENFEQPKDLETENAELRSRLQEAEETLDAIRGGGVEALVVGDQIFMLQSAEQASNRFRGHVLEQVNDIVVAIDDDRRLTYINPAAERKYGVSASDALGQKLQDLFKIRWIKENDEAEANKKFAEKGFWRGECLHIPANGDEFHAEVIVSRLRDEDGLDEGMLAVIRDITDRKKAEAELREAHHKLEERVVERTKELATANESLQQEIKTREVVERQRTELLQRIVRTQEDERRRIARDIHDQLGQRVTALRLQIATLADRSTDASKHEGQLEILRRTAMRLDSEIGFLAWELRPMSLDDLGLPEAAKAFVEEWSHNYKITSDFILRGFIRERLDPEVETHLYRILQESLNNVAKHAAATSVNVLLHWKKDEVALIVEDNGRGFDAGKTMGAKNGGKGLGLLGMYERAVLIDGTVEIESARGKGTTIYARVPIAGKSVRGSKKKQAA